MLEILLIWEIGVNVMNEPLDADKICVYSWESKERMMANFSAKQTLPVHFSKRNICITPPLVEVQKLDRISKSYHVTKVSLFWYASSLNI